jgi:hypothetical protein
MKNITTLVMDHRRNWMDIIGCVLGWFAIVGQFILMIQNRQADVVETVVRFFSFFTILTNILVALYFSSRITKHGKVSLQIAVHKSALTALTTFILVVGLVYQIVLRNTWVPTGFQLIIDELLHSVIPVFVLIYWILFANKTDLILQNNINWLWFPAIYFVFIIIRGHFSNFYPYPFINVSAIGYFKVFINFLMVSGFMLSIMALLIFIGQKIKK